MAAGIVPVCPYHRKPSSVCSGGFFGSQGGGASGVRRVAGRSGFRSADSHCGVFRTVRPNICRCNSSPHATSVRPTRRAGMRARPLICHRHTAGQKPHAPISPAGGGRFGFAAEPTGGFYPRPWAHPPNPHKFPQLVGFFVFTIRSPPAFLPAGMENTRDTCRAAIRAMHQ